MRAESLADLRPDADASPLLTVIVPAYNEGRTIDALLRQVVAASYEKQIIVVDDGSTDDTAKILSGWQERPNFLLLRHSANRGKGAAIRTALTHAAGEFVLIQDADLEYDPGDYSRLIEPLIRGQADVVFGSRYLQTTSGPRRRWRLFRHGVSLLNFCVRLIYKVKISDEVTCYKASPTSLLRAMNLECRGFEFCSEVTAKVCRLGLTIFETPVHYHPRGFKDGKKIRWSDGIRLAWALWKWRKWTGEWKPRRQLAVEGTSSPDVGDHEAEDVSR